MEFSEQVDGYCDGSAAEADLVKSKTAEEFHFWLERKIKAAKRLEAELKKTKR